MKGLNFKSNLKPTPNSFMSADQWGEEVRIEPPKFGQISFQKQRLAFQLHLKTDWHADNKKPEGYKSKLKQ